MRLFVGVNNIYTGINYNTNTNAAWMGEVVSAIDSWLNGSGWSGLEYAEAGSDTETEWASYSPYTINYLRTVAANDGGSPIYDFGDAGGCNTGGYSSNGSCNGGWTQGQVLDVSWVESWAWPLPEIYNQNSLNAYQWYWISLGSYRAGSGPITFYGSLTQYQACQQVGGCNGTANTPDQGWTQLYNSIYTDPNTRPGDIMTWSDDMRYLG
jgi:hypothetical protein